MITLDLADVINPGSNFQNATPFVTNFSITVTGAGSGDGTFGFSDFNGASIAGGFDLLTPSTLNFNSQLVGLVRAVFALLGTQSTIRKNHFRAFTGV